MKDTIKKTKHKLLTGRNVCKEYLERNVYTEYINNSYDSAITRQTIQLINGKRYEKTFLCNTQMDNKHTKRCLKLPAAIEIWRKNTIKYHYIPTRVAKINKTNITECWRGCGTMGALIHCRWNQILQPLWKSLPMSYNLSIHIIHPSSHIPIYLPKEIEHMFSQR